MFHRLRTILTVSVLFGAGWAFAETGGFALPDNGRFLIPVGAGEAMLNQCSRAVPTNVSQFWPPSTDQVAKLEMLLPGYLHNRISEKQRAPDNIAFHRQYIGIVVGGRHLIYGNFYPADMPFPRNEKSIPVVVCDGGASFWGTVFDPKGNSFIELQLNGEV